MNQDGLGCVDFVYFEDGKELCTIPIEKEVVHMVSDAFLKFMEASS
jgi:hypothetical protein